MRRRLRCDPVCNAVAALEFARKSEKVPAARVDESKHGEVVQLSHVHGLRDTAAVKRGVMRLEDRRRVRADEVDRVRFDKIPRELEHDIGERFRELGLLSADKRIHLRHPHLHEHRGTGFLGRCKSRSARHLSSSLDSDHDIALEHIASGSRHLTIFGVPPRNFRNQCCHII
eukprot:Amastigsp_a343_365.p3 type:complete len:172 gc:universal Amastigsp_a343_365:196-711(+)